MARQRKRRSTRRLEDLPGLFDDIDLGHNNADPLVNIVNEHRKRQVVPDTPITALDIELDPEILQPKSVLQFISFGSGSSGNCAYLGIRNQGGILIDAGIDADRVKKELAANGISYDRISGIIITHDHGDHIRYLYQLVRKRPNMHIYCTMRTLNGILQRHNVSRRIKDYHYSIYRETSFQAGPFQIVPFEVSHDGSENMGFCITANNRNFVVATDMGCITERADYYIRMANYLMIEANYDNDMLETGKYPEYLKARIRSERGHLDNAVTAAYLAKIWKKTLTDIYLCHLSHDNNTPEIAFQAIRQALTETGINVSDASGSVESRRADVRVSTLPRFESSPLHIHRLD